MKVWYICYFYWVLLVGATSCSADSLGSLPPVNYLGEFTVNIAGADTKQRVQLFRVKPAKAVWSHLLPYNRPIQQVLVSKTGNYTALFLHNGLHKERLLYFIGKKGQRVGQWRLGQILSAKELSLIEDNPPSSEFFASIWRPTVFFSQEERYLVYASSWISRGAIDLKAKRVLAQSSPKVSQIIQAKQNSLRQRLARAKGHERCDLILDLTALKDSRAIPILKKIATNATFSSPADRVSRVYAMRSLFRLKCKEAMEVFEAQFQKLPPQQQNQWLEALSDADEEQSRHFLANWSNMNPTSEVLSLPLRISMAQEWRQSLEAKILQAMQQ